MKNIILVLLIALAISSTDYDDRNYHIYDVYTNTKYPVDVTRYPQMFLPAGHSYFFRLPVKPNDNMQIMITVQRNAIIDFKVDVCPFSYRPSDAEITIGNEACVNNLYYTKTIEATYELYSFPFTTSSNVNYITAHVQNLNSLYYMDVYIYSEKDYYGQSYSVKDIDVLKKSLIP